MNYDALKRVIRKNDSKIFLVVLDGLGGLPGPEGLTELETAGTPAMDKLASEGICGLHRPLEAGMTPGSGPSHLALFGYDPFRYEVGRGVLSALGVDFDLTDRDIAARGNFCTIDGEGNISDRRAGRIDTATNEELCSELRELDIPGAEIFVRTVKEHRFLLVIRGDDLSGNIGDTDPQRTGVKPLEPESGDRKAQKTIETVKTFISRAREKLSGRERANMVLLRGFSRLPGWPSMEELFGVNALGIAEYPMYRGVAKLVGMDTCAADGDNRVETVKEHLRDYGYFYIHLKTIDSAGEDGDFGRKAGLIEKADDFIAEIMEFEPEVIAVTGDHSSPSSMKSHSWHPVPLLIHSADCRTDGVKKFGERACMSGGLGPSMSSLELMPLLLACAGRIEKYGP